MTMADFAILAFVSVVVYLCGVWALSLVSDD
jgi:hypothetical protein